MLELLVAGDAGHRRVCVVERELVVLLGPDVAVGGPKGTLSGPVQDPQVHCRGTQLRGWHSGRILKVTGGALHLLVTNFQRVLGESVLRHRVRGRPPALDRVAGSAVHDSAGEGGRAGVRVRVAVRAIRERWVADHLASGEVVTLLARHFAVATAQRIAGAVVIELPPVDGLEIRRPVAVTGTRAEAPAVDRL